MADEVKKFISILLNIVGAKDTQKEIDTTFKKSHDGSQQTQKDSKGLG